ncbi:MAG: hypothetical protein ACRDJF_10460 [Actinomycetota bacterium]
MTMTTDACRNAHQEWTWPRPEEAVSWLTDVGPSLLKMIGGAAL